MAIPGRAPPPGEAQPFSPNSIGRPVLPYKTAVDNQGNYLVGGVRKALNYNLLTALMLAGDIVMLEQYDPTQASTSEIFGLPKEMQDWFFSQGLLVPGKYQYLGKFRADAATMAGGVDTSSNKFSGTNPGTIQRTGPLQVSPFTSITFHFVNASNQPATYQIYGSTSQNLGGTDYGALPGNGTGTLNSEQGDLPIGLSLTLGTIKYMYATIGPSGTAPTAGYYKIVPIVRRIA